MERTADGGPGATAPAADGDDRSRWKHLPEPVDPARWVTEQPASSRPEATDHDELGRLLRIWVGP